MLANLMNGKDSGLVKFDVSEPEPTLNKITMDGLKIGVSRKWTCLIHDNVYPVLIKECVLNMNTVIGIHFLSN